MSKFTPGSWDAAGLSVFAKDERICRMSNDGPEDYKNAAAIALLPEMVEVLRAFIRGMDAVRRMNGYKEGQGDLWLGPAMFGTETAARAILAKLD